MGEAAEEAVEAVPPTTTPPPAAWLAVAPARGVTGIPSSVTKAEEEPPEGGSWPEPDLSAADEALDGPMWFWSRSFTIESTRSASRISSCVGGEGRSYPIWLYRLRKT